MNARLLTLFAALSVLSLALLTQSFAAQSRTQTPEHTPPAQIAAAPAKVTVDISKGRAGGSIRVFNLGSEPISIHTTINHWTMDNNNQVQVIAPTAQSLDQWLIVNPINFTIQPGKQQVVRYSIRPKAQPQVGEHRAMIFFNQTPDVATAGSIGVHFRMGVAVYGVVGEISRTGQLHNLSVDYRNNAVTLAADIQSNGNGNVRLEGQISVWQKAHYPGASAVSLYDLSDSGWNVPAAVVSAAVLTSTPVLPGSRRIVNTIATLPNESGDYIVHVTGLLGDQAVQESLLLRIP